MKKNLIFLLLILVSLSGTISANAQNRIRANGTVTDEQGPLVGATVLLKGTSTAVMTDLDGRFTMEVNEGAILSFQYIGYETQELAAATNMQVVLTTKAEDLDELIVIGYGVQRKSDVTGSISSVREEDIAGRSITRPEQALGGKTSGVQIIQSSAAPGSAPTIRVRGISSNSSAVTPLYVVDGLRVSDIGYLDPNNIESMEVLKDAASAAIYGARAGNGVVLITTKSGSNSQDGRISYEGQHVWQSLARIPRVMNASQYINYMLEGNVISQSELDLFYDGVTDTNWSDTSFETSMMERHNLSFMGGNDRGSVFVSLNYLTNDGIVKGDKDVYDRLTAQVNAEYKIKKWFKVGANTSLEKWASQSVSEGSEYGSLLCATLAMDPLTPNLYDQDNLPISMLKNMNDPNWVASYGGYLRDENGDYYATSSFISSEQVHPMIMRDAATSKSDGFNALGNLFAEFTPIKGLTLTSRLGYRASYSNSNSFGDLYYANDMVFRKDDITLSGTASNSLYYQWENFADYSFFKDKHSFNAMVGMSFSETSSNYVNASTNKLTKNLENFRYLAYSDATATRGIGGISSQSAQMSYFARASYSYANKYMVQLIVRRDAFDSSVLPEEERWGTFPSISAGWTISNESFMPKNGPLSFLKLRASWGENGNIGPLGGYVYKTSISSSYSYPYTNAIDYNIGSSPTGLTNPDLKWETSQQLDLGLDVRMFKDKLSFTFDFFNKNTRDLLVSTTPPYETGVSSTTINAGDVHNHGFEFELGWRHSIGDFTYAINGNLSTLTNEVTYLDPSISRINGGSFHTQSGLTAFEVGYPVWYFRGYNLLDIDDATGDPVFEDITGDGTISDDDRTYMGSALPDFTYGLTINLAWKGIDFTAFGSGSQGNDIMSLLNRVDRPRGNKMSIYYEDRWTPTNTSATAPRPACNGENYYWYSSAAVFDGSYFKIKQIQLGYSLPQTWMRAIKVNSLRLYVSLDDWFCFSSYPGMDPEVASYGTTSGMGMDKGQYPTSKKTMIGLNITF